MSNPAFLAISHFIRGVFLRLPLVAVVKKIGVLRFGQFLQLPLMLFRRQFHAFVKFILCGVGNFLFFELIALGLAGRKKTLFVDRFPDRLGLGCIGQGPRKLMV